MRYQQSNLRIEFFLFLFLLSYFPIWLTCFLSVSFWARSYYSILSMSLLIILPVLCNRLFPVYASFEGKILPSRKRDYFMIPPVFIALLAILLLTNILLLKHGFSEPTPIIYNHRQLFLSLFISIGMVPIGEEYFWRGYAMEQFVKVFNPSSGVFLTSFLFALAHIPAYGIYCIPVFAVGIILGIWRLRCKSLLPLIIVHSMLNIAVKLPMILINR